MIPYCLTHVFSYRAAVAPPEFIGPVGEGFRVNFYVTGGEVTGPKVRGKLRPHGGDFFLLSPNGVGNINARITLETDDGALIYMTYPGVADFGLDGYEKFLRNEPIPPGFIFHAAPRCYTSHPEYLWLNRYQYLSNGQLFLDRSEVSFDVYQVGVTAAGG